MSRATPPRHPGTSGEPGGRGPAPGAGPGALAGCRPIWIEVDLNAVSENFRLLRNRIGTGRAILAMVKADAYGHGAVEVARRLASDGVEWFGVAAVEEGQQLREAGIRLPVLVLGAFSPGQLPAMDAACLTPCAYSLSSLASILSYSPASGGSLGFHLKVDTGMGRLGVQPDQLDEAIATILSAGTAARLDGFFTHLSCADDPEDPHTARQLELFGRLAGRLRASGLTPRFVHAANSGGALDHPASRLDLIRAGIALYGLHPSSKSSRAPLRPALALKSRLVLVRRVGAGTPIGYGRTFVTERPGVVGTIAGGYADGVFRLLSNRGRALVRGRRVPFAGRVSMDHSALDLTQVEGAAEGDEVVLIGRQGEEEISAEEFAGWAETISYEAVCRLGRRVARVYLPEGRVEKRL
ncbi:MAG TPA: alanine racemase [Candidatus Polarisedimenticolia bacterium]|nr:alanine racemase [Candidatus Polarisedimenticolia bacterium]